MQKLLEIKNLKVHFPLKKNIFSKTQVVYAVDNVSFDIYAGETIGIVGESGCGKSSLARSLVGLNKITAGEVVFLNSEHLETASTSKWHKYREDIQFIFQDPVASLNPRMTVAEIIAEPLEIYNPTLTKIEVMNRVVEIMKLVGLSVNQINRYPLEFSGGQCQRIGIARALILKPKLIICDESVSALDASIKAQIINLLKDLQKQLNLTIIFISHDLSVVKHICDRVLVMYLGNIMELSTKNILYTKSHHPYSSALLSAVPIANPDVERKKVIKLLEGELPSSINPPVGCVFNSRCPKADDKCWMSRPPVSVLEDGSLVACFHPD